jgi:type IV pilus assembly protein PilE
MNIEFRSTPDRDAMHNYRAFTLLELMIVCSLVAILLALATPAYHHYLLRAHRSTAIETLLAAAACQERIYAGEFNYDTNRCLAHGDEEKYQVRFEPAATAAASTFIVMAEPVAAQRNDPCGTLSLDQSGTRGISGPVESLRKCWEGR